MLHWRLEIAKWTPMASIGINVHVVFSKCFSDIMFSHLLIYIRPLIAICRFRWLLMPLIIRLLWERLYYSWQRITMIILVYLSVGRKDIMKIGYTVFYVFESARLEDKALYRRSLYRLFQERSPYRLFSKGAAASIRTNNGFRSSHEFTHSSCNPIFRIV